MSVRPVAEVQRADPSGLQTDRCYFLTAVLLPAEFATPVGLYQLNRVFTEPRSVAQVHRPLIVPIIPIYPFLPLGCFPGAFRQTFRKSLKSWA